MIPRGDTVKVIGDDARVEKATRVLGELSALGARGNSIDEQSVDYAIASAMDDREPQMLSLDNDVVCRTVSGTSAPAGSPS